MTFVAGGKNFFPGHPARLPLGSRLHEPVHRLPALVTALVLSGHQVGNWSAVAGDDDTLAAFDRPEELGQPRLGLGSLNFTHIHYSNWLK